jgi:hypothetical protein
MDEAQVEGPTSLYEVTSVSTATPGGPGPHPPGTALTASIETVDNDRAGLLHAVGVLR